MRTKQIISAVLFCVLAILPINSQWQQTALTGNYFRLAGNTSIIFSSNTNMMRYTTDGGLSWEIVPQGFGGWIHDIDANEQLTFAAIQMMGLYRSTDNGESWVRHQLSADGVRSVKISGNNIYAGLQNYGMVKSTNNGVNWISVPVGGGTILFIAANGDNLFAARESSGVLRSLNGGQNWTQTGLGYFVNSLAVNGSIVYAAVQNMGVYISTDNGTAWNKSPITNQSATSLALTGNSVFAGTTASGVYLSTNNGSSWVQVNEGLTTLTVNDLLLNNGFIYAATNTGVWKRSLSELVSINAISSEIPAQYNLYQNYPNPFNPATKVKFSLPKQSNVQLSVYSASGQLIQTLVNQNLNAGTYEADFDGSNMASGVYFYSIESGTFKQTKKMVLIK